jgi:hypothetical protein
MRFLTVAALAAVLLAPGLASAAVSCSDLPKAEAYVHDNLRPGPNTRLALRHLAAARHARSDRQCRTELGRVNYYAKRSLAADARGRR